MTLPGPSLVEHAALAEIGKPKTGLPIGDRMRQTLFGKDLIVLKGSQWVLTSRGHQTLRSLPIAD